MSHLPAPGQLIDVGGHRLHIQVRGEGGPTVVFDHGTGSTGLIWELVAPAVSQFTRTVVYDRAGYGWSDPGPLPRTSDRTVDELHTLLHKASIPGPYLLVGHSFGGLNMRIYANRYPDEVAGLVLVDATHEDELTDRFPPEHIKGQKLLPKMISGLLVMSRLGILRLLAAMGKLGGISELAKRFPGTTGKALIAQSIRPAALVANRDEFRHMETGYALARANPGLGDRPLVVLVHGKPGPVPPGATPAIAAQIEALSLQVATEMAALSSRGRLVVAEQSGHEIMVTEPELVIQAIRDVMAQAIQADANRAGTAAAAAAQEV